MVDISIVSGIINQQTSLGGTTLYTPVNSYSYGIDGPFIDKLHIEHGDVHSYVC